MMLRLFTRFSGVMFAVALRSFSVPGSICSSVCGACVIGLCDLHTQYCNTYIHTLLMPLLFLLQGASPGASVGVGASSSGARLALMLRRPLLRPALPL